MTGLKVGIKLDGAIDKYEGNLLGALSGHAEPLEIRRSYPLP